MSDWIPWEGDKRPVDRDVDVGIQLRHRDGEIRHRSGFETAGWFDDLGWWSGWTKQGPTMWRICAYRLAPTPNDIRVGECRQGGVM